MSKLITQTTPDGYRHQTYVLLVVLVKTVH